MKYILPLFVFFTLLLSTIGQSFALDLQNIGTLSTAGKKYTEWWYTGINPTFSGIAAANSTVKLTVNTTSYDVKSDATGKWTQSTTNPAGDYNVTIVGDGTTYSFKLHLGQSMSEGTTTGSTAPRSNVPNTGSEQVVAVLFSLGVILLASYFYFWGSQNNNSKFEKYFLDN